MRASKYNVGDVVWYADRDGVGKRTIIKSGVVVKIGSYYNYGSNYQYYGSNFQLPEHYLFKSEDGVKRAVIMAELTEKRNYSQFCNMD